MIKNGKVISVLLVLLLLITACAEEAAPTATAVPDSAPVLAEEREPAVTSEPIPTDPPAPTTEAPEDQPEPTAETEMEPASFSWPPPLSAYDQLSAAPVTPAETER